MYTLQKPGSFIEDISTPCWMQMFSFIKDVHLNNPLNLMWIDVKQWYQLLLERGVTHTSDYQESPAILIPSRPRYQGRDLSHTYRMARLVGLSPELKTFLFKMIQN
jgi:hypothetical protein